MVQHSPFVYKIYIVMMRRYETHPENGLCNDAGPISGFGRHPASTQSLFSDPGHAFAMMRDEIRENERGPAIRRGLAVCRL